jgi:hypothetical protein
LGGDIFHKMLPKFARKIIQTLSNIALTPSEVVVFIKNLEVTMGVATIYNTHKNLE